MNEQDYNEWRELGWRRKLTASEEAELQRHLAAHPADEADWQAEAELNRLLERLPEAPPVSSNFTARVLKSVELEAAAKTRERAQVPLLRSIWNWLPRAAVATAVVGFLWVGHYHSEVMAERQALARNVAGLAQAVSSDPELMKDFEPIRRLSDSQPVVDTELIALMK